MLRVFRMKDLLILRITIVAVMIALMLASCEASQSDVEEFSSSFTADESLSHDLKGYEFVMQYRTTAFTPEYGDSAAGDKVLARYKEIEKEFNCTVTASPNIGNIVADWFCGFKTTDLLYTQLSASWAAGYFTNGMYYPFSELDIDLTDIRYGSSGVHEAGTLGNDVFTVYPYYWTVNAPSISTVMWFNPTYIKKFGQTDPYELYENGQWDWEHFDYICRNMRDDSDPDKKKHLYAVGYNNDNAYLELAAIASNNGRIVSFDKNGLMYNSLGSENIREALEFILSLIKDDFIICDGASSNREPFVTGKRAFYLEYTKQGLSSEGADKVGSLMEDPFEWIMFPHGPKADQSVVTTSFSYYSDMVYLMANADVSCTELILPYLYDVLPGDTLDNWDADFKSMNFYSERSYRFYKEILDRSGYDYTNYTPFETIKSTIYSISSSSKTLTEALSNINDKVQESIDKLYNIPMKLK